MMDRRAIVVAHKLLRSVHDDAGQYMRRVVVRPAVVHESQHYHWVRREDEIVAEVMRDL